MSKPEGKCCMCDKPAVVKVGAQIIYPMCQDHADWYKSSGMPTR